MMRVKQLGAIVFEHNSMFVEEDDKPNSVMGEMYMSGAGSHVFYEASITTPYITLVSKEYSWVTEEQKTALLAMWANLGVTYTITYDNLGTDTVRLAREKQISFTPIHEGACYYYAVIPTAKV